jgi:cytochrome P450
VFNFFFLFLLVISDRKKSGATRGDLLDLMLHGKDPETGKGLSDEAIRREASAF